MAKDTDDLVFHGITPDKQDGNAKTWPGESSSRGYRRRDQRPATPSSPSPLMAPRSLRHVFVGLGPVLQHLGTDLSPLDTRDGLHISATLGHRSPNEYPLSQVPLFSQTRLHSRAELRCSSESESLAAKRYPTALAKTPSFSIKTPTVRLAGGQCFRRNKIFAEKSRATFDENTRSEAPP